MYLPLHAHLLEPTDDGIGDAFSYGLSVFAGLFYILLNFWGYWNNLKKLKKKNKPRTTKPLFRIESKAGSKPLCPTSKFCGKFAICK